MADRGETSTQKESVCENKTQTNQCIGVSRTKSI